jgi:hypothetical protein
MVTRIINGPIGRATDDRESCSSNVSRAFIRMVWHIVMAVLTLAVVRARVKGFAVPAGPGARAAAEHLHAGGPHRRAAGDPPEMREEIFNRADSWELLDQQTNGTAGPMMAASTRRQRAIQAAWDLSTIGKVLIFDRVELDGSGRPGSAGARTRSATANNSTHSTPPTIETPDDDRYAAAALTTGRGRQAPGAVPRPAGLGPGRSARAAPGSGRVARRRYRNHVAV